MSRLSVALQLLAFLLFAVTTCTSGQGLSGSIPDSELFGYGRDNTEFCAHLDPPCSYNADCVQTVDGWSCQCRPGYEGNGHMCQDINECLASRPCDVNADCLNTDGSFDCVCLPGYEGDGRFCQLTRDGTFIPNPEEEKSNLPSGIFLELRGGDTITINQLEARAWVDPGWKVRRRGGDLVEADVYYDIPADMLAGEVGTYVIPYHAEDMDGNRADPVARRVQVIDVDECALGIHSCSIHADCINTEGSYECVCKAGFIGDGFKCTDINECRLGTHDCDVHARCENTQGGFECICEEGYEGNGKICTDIDECKRGTHKCDENAFCINTDGSYTCQCQDGFVGNGFECKPVDSCETGTHDCDVHATCSKTDELPEGYRCTCNKGYVGDGRKCYDINECATNAYDCPYHSHCVNTEGSYECACDPGFERGEDGYSCVDINECLREIDDCSPNAICTNTVGSYECVCKEGYVGNGKVCTSIAPPTDIILRGANPMLMKQCDTYKEESFMLVDPKKQTLRVTVKMPPALMEDLVMITGTHQVQYHVADEGQHKATVIRNVTVERINPCILPAGHPCRHKCHPYAQCIPDDYSSVGYRCECADGFETIYVNDTTICKDNVPPVIKLQGPETVILRACRMCKWYDPGETYDEKRHGGYFAYDPMPDDNRIDLTDKVVITNETIIPDKQWKIYYNVVDWAGNKAITKERTVIREVEDVLRRIENVESFLHQKFAEFDPYPKKIDMFTAYLEWLLRAILMVIGLLVVLYLLPRVVNLVKVSLSSTKPNFDEFMDGYDLLYAMIRPWEGVQSRHHRVHIQYQRKYNDN